MLKVQRSALMTLSRLAALAIAGLALQNLACCQEVVCDQAQLDAPSKTRPHSASSPFSVEVLPALRFRRCVATAFGGIMRGG